MPAKGKKQIAVLDAELARLGIQEQEIKTFRKRRAELRRKNQALTVFNQIRPGIPVMLQDIDRIPKQYKIESISKPRRRAASSTSCKRNSTSCRCCATLPAGLNQLLLRLEILVVELKLLVLLAHLMT